jgi:methyl-accepting chemotaxis protein
VNDVTDKPEASGGAQVTASKRRRRPRRRTDTFIEQLTDAVGRIADGDGAVTLPEPVPGDPLTIRLKDSVAVLVEAFRSVSSKTEAFERMRRLGHDMAAATAEILAASRQQAASAAEQAASVSDITTTMQELNEVAVQNVEKTQSIIQIAEQSEQISQDGQRDVAAATEETEHLRQQVGLIASKILDLTERTQQIGEIISSVNEIAEQSKLLALNASIEAAKAGEHGRGFAVVALEIRTLAEQSKQATRQVRSILSEIQKASHSAALVTEEGSKAAAESNTKVRRIGERLGQLVYVITQTTRSSRQIAAAIKQEAVGLEQIAGAMMQINRATQEAKLSIEQAEKAIGFLNDLSQVARSVGMESE